MKYILVIGDGMADNPLEELAGKTPLAHADTPIMDKLCSKGCIGTALTIPPGQAAGSDTAILSIFGCDPVRYNKGRAPLEAAASGITVPAGFAAFRCNMVSLEEGTTAFADKKILSHSGGDIDGESSIALITHLFSHPEFAPLAKANGLTIHPSPGFRHIAVQENADLTGFSAFPPHDYLGKQIHSILPTGNQTATALKVLMEKAHDILTRHPINQARRDKGLLPANGVWFWAQGVSVELPKFTSRYDQAGGVISAVALCHGIAALTGLLPIQVEGATGTLHTNYEGKVQAAINSLKYNGDFVAIHVEAPDECTHNGDLEGKLQAIEWLDSRVLKNLLAGLQEAGMHEYRILVLSDHKTLMETRGHNPDPVPFFLYDSRVDIGCGATFTEENAQAYGKILNSGTMLMPLLFSDKL